METRCLLWGWGYMLPILPTCYNGDQMFAMRLRLYAAHITNLLWWRPDVCYEAEAICCPCYQPATMETRYHPAMMETRYYPAMMETRCTWECKEVRFWSCLHVYEDSHYTWSSTLHFYELSCYDGDKILSCYDGDQSTDAFEDRWYFLGYEISDTSFRYQTQALNIRHKLQIPDTSFEYQTQASDTRHKLWIPDTILCLYMMRKLIMKISFEISSIWYFNIWGSNVEDFTDRSQNLILNWFFSMGSWDAWMVPKSNNNNNNKVFCSPSPVRLLRSIAYTRLCTRYALSASWDTHAGGGGDGGDSCIMECIYWKEGRRNSACGFGKRGIFSFYRRSRNMPIIGILRPGDDFKTRVQILWMFMLYPWLYNKVLFSEPIFSHSFIFSQTLKFQ